MSGPTSDSRSLVVARGAIRPPTVAGAFYPADPDRLGLLVDAIVADAADLLSRRSTGSDASGGGLLRGVLVPHAGLIYSGVVAAAGWLAVAEAPPDTIVILGTNHGAGWLDGIGAWEAGAWRTPMGASAVDATLAEEILGLGSPFVVDRPAHLEEHSIEVQLPILERLLPRARIVPLAVATGSGARAIAAGAALGSLLERRRAAGSSIVLAVSSDMAHYPTDDACRRATGALLPSIERLDAVGLARAEREVVATGRPSLVCGMCGIAPAVVGLAALAAMGATRGTTLAAATSADAGGPFDRTVGYLSVAFA